MQPEARSSFYANFGPSRSRGHVPASADARLGTTTTMQPRKSRVAANLPHAVQPSTNLAKKQPNRPKSSFFCYLWSGHNRASPAFSSACNPAFSQIRLYFANKSACNPTKSRSFIGPQAYKCTPPASRHLFRFPSKIPIFIFAQSSPFAYNLAMDFQLATTY